MNALRAGQDAPTTVFEVIDAVALILNMSVFIFIQVARQSVGRSFHNRYLSIHLSPRWGLGIVLPIFYIPIAPLGLFGSGKMPDLRRGDIVGFYGSPFNPTYGP